MSKSAPHADSLSLVARHVRDGNRSMARLELDVQMAVLHDQSAAWLWEAWLSESPAEARSALQRAQELDQDSQVIDAGLAFVEGLLNWRPADIETDFEIDPGFFIDADLGPRVAPIESDDDIETDFDIDPEFLIDPGTQGPIELLELAEAAIESVASESVDEYCDPLEGNDLESESSRPLILVVDDSRTIRELVAFTLSRAGYEVITASDGAEALREITNRCPALVISDTIMPKLDGYELCRLIRQHETASKTPVVLLSENDGIVEKTRRFAVGCTDHLRKPFASQVLIDTVQNRAATTTTESVGH